MADKEHLEFMARRRARENAIIEALGNDPGKWAQWLKNTQAESLRIRKLMNRPTLSRLHGSSTHNET